MDKRKRTKRQTLPTKHYQNTTHKTLPTKHYPRNTTHETLPTKHYPQNEWLDNTRGERVNTDAPEVKTNTVSKTLCEHGPF